MTDETTPTPAKKPGRPRKAAAQAATSPSKASKPAPGPQVPDLPEITVEQLVEGMDDILVRRMYKHLIGGAHRLTIGEARIELGFAGADKDEEWNRIVGQ